ncbi:MAG: diguanylate cyclase [Mycobacteriales bacterium]|nr:diguanylate cyclase [Mycobacteriales bacterium]
MDDRPVVLLAEDSPTVRALVRVELEDAGYAVVEAADGRVAVDLARQSAPSVVLLDVEMPVLDGYGVIAELKVDPATRDVPVVILTGQADLVKALDAGAHDFVRKPPQQGELRARVAAAVRVKVLQDELRARADELERVSRTDHLTGLHNRRHIEEHLRRLRSGARRHGYPLAVLVIDVDHFKQVNDTLGHAGGDEVLIEVARRLGATVRREDLVGRWGGEEFIVLAPHTDLPAAAALGERLRMAVGGTPVLGGGRALTVTISVGAAAGDGDDDLVVQADRHLYAAKAAGRDRVEADATV